MLTLTQFTKGVKLPANLTENANRTLRLAHDLEKGLPGKLRFTSGYRTAARNKAIGGVPNSKHVAALALDYVPNDGNFNKYRKTVEEIAARHQYEVLVHDAGSGNHFHLEFEPGKFPATKATK